jgi:glycosyltransferase involved in cell wall biosynthesis
MIPIVSIIIPTFNRCKLLQDTIESIFSHNTATDLFEIIVVDNGSTDETKEIVENIQNENSSFNLYYFFDDIPGLLSGRHRGAKEARGEILSFIDDDVLVSETWLEGIIERMNENKQIALLSGPCLPKYESNPPEWLNDFWTKNENGIHCGWLSLMDFGSEEIEIDPLFVWGLNFTIRKSVFKELKGFHPDNIPKKLQHFQGDGETGLSLKAKEKGFKAYYNPRVNLFHQIPNSRLTENYFSQRAFYQGVANSYTQIRVENGLYFTNEKSKSDSVGFFKLVKKSLKKMINSKSKQREFDDSLAFKFKMSEIEGFNFHQKMFKENEFVRTWTLQNDYLNYDLPII